MTTTTPDQPVPPVPEPDFALARDEDLTAGVRRALLEQLGYATHLLRFEPNLDRTVHEFRKSLKRSRAVLRLVRGPLGRFRYRQENVVMRDVARAWAPARDAVVIAEVTRDLLTELERDSDEVGAHLLATLDERAAASTASFGADRPLHLDTLTTLLSLRSRVAAFPRPGDELGEGFENDFTSVRTGLLKVAQRSSSEMQTARSEPTTVHLHQWRKRAKYLGYQLQFLGPVWEDLIGAYAARLKDLGSALGDEHDLAVLGELLAAEPELAPDRSWREGLFALIGDRRDRLRAEAFTLGESIFTAPRRVVDQIGDAWPVGRG